MNEETITFKWIKNNKQYQNRVNKKEFFDIIDSLKKGFNEDNEISKQLVEVIPKVDTIKINYDANANRDVPMIEYVTKTAGRGAISIIRYHKIIWSILDKYCS